MEQTMLVRLKAHEPKKGLVLKQYTYRGVRFQAGRGWYKVNGELAAYLANVHSVPGDPDTPLAFDVRTLDEARAMDENDRKAARQVLPAEEPLDVSHVRDEQTSVQSRRSTTRDNVTRQQRQPARSPEDEQLDAAEDDAIEDEAPRRRAPRPRSQAVPRRRPREDGLKDADAFDDDELDDEDAEFEDEAPRRRARRSRTEVAPRRHARAAAGEDFDALDEDEFDAEDDEFDDDEEYLQAEPPQPRRRVEAKAPRHRREYDVDDDAPARRSQRRPDERDELDGFDDEEIEDAPPTRRLTHRSHDLRARRPLSRAADGYDRDDALDDDRQTRRVQGTRQAEALDAFRNREARRMRRQHTQEDQYEEMPARRVQKDAVERELDDEPTQKLRRSRSQEDQQHELRTRHARQMATKLGQMDALDDALSHGDAEDSLPAAATRNRHNSHGDAEDSLPNTRTRSKHVSQRDAEDSLPDEATSYGDAEDSLPPRNRYGSHGDAEDSLSTRNRHNGHRDAEDSLPGVRRMQHQDAPSSRHTADAQDDLDAVDHDSDDRNVEEPARPDARSQRAQQPPSSAAHDELDALDDALDDSLKKASEDQRPGSAQPPHAPQRTSSNPQRHPEGGHNAASDQASRDQRQPWPDDDPFVNRDACDQAPASAQGASQRAAAANEPETAAPPQPRQGRRIYVPGPNTHTRDDRSPRGRQRRNG